MDWDSCGLLERKNVALGTWKTLYFELAHNLLCVYDDESKNRLLESLTVDENTSVEVQPIEDHRKYIFSVTHSVNHALTGEESTTTFILSTSSSSLLESWMLAFIQISRGSFTPSERFSISSHLAAPLFNTTRQSELASPLETDDFLAKSASMTRRMQEIQSEQFLTPDPWFNSPSGWLRKPDFKRTEQRASAAVAPPLKTRSSNLLHLTKSLIFQTHTFKKRWFALNTKTNILAYYDSSDPTPQTHLGNIDLAIVKQVRPSIVPDAPPNSIDLVCSEVVYTLVADSFELMCNWAFAVQKVLTKLQDASEIKSIVELQYANNEDHLNNLNSLKHLSINSQRSQTQNPVISSDADQQRENKAPNIIRRLDFSSTELISAIMAHTQQSQTYLQGQLPPGFQPQSSELRAFFAKIVHALKHNTPMDVSAGSFSAGQNRFTYIPSHSHDDLMSVLEGNGSAPAGPVDKRLSTTMRSCQYPGCTVLHHYLNGYCKQHWSMSVSSTATSTPLHTHDEEAEDEEEKEEEKDGEKEEELEDEELEDENNDEDIDQVPSGEVDEDEGIHAAYTQPGLGHEHEEEQERVHVHVLSPQTPIQPRARIISRSASSSGGGLARTLTSTGAVDDPADPNNKRKNLSLQVKRISLREAAQDIADYKTEQAHSRFFALATIPPAINASVSNVSSMETGLAADLLQEAKQLLFISDVENYFEDSELVQLFAQFKTMDVDCDGLITVFDIRELVASVDRDWFTSKDHRVQCLLNEAAKDWLMSASVDGTDEIDFEGFIRALIRKRNDEANNYGYPESCMVPTELSAHPFWDLRSVVCTNYWAMQSQQSTRAGGMNDEPSPSVADESRPSMLVRPPSTDSGPRRSLVAHSSELCGWIFKRGYAIPVEHMNAWKLRYFRLVCRNNRHLLEYAKGFLGAESSNGGSRRGRSRQNEKIKGCIDIQEIVYFDFSPKTTVVFDSALMARVKQVNKQQSKPKAANNPAYDTNPAFRAPNTLTIDTNTLIAFKLIMRNGRRYTLACGEVEALHWVAELIRFGAKYQAEADWRRNWGSFRHTRVCLRDWINAASIMPRLARYCEARLTACDMINEARTRALAHTHTKAQSPTTRESEGSTTHSATTGTGTTGPSTPTSSNHNPLEGISHIQLSNLPITTTTHTGATFIFDEAAYEDEIHATKTLIAEMLEACALSKKDFICLGVIGITLEGWDSAKDVLRRTMATILAGIYRCCANSAHVVEGVRSVPFADATDFEASKLLEGAVNNSSGGGGGLTESELHAMGALSMMNNSILPLSLFSQSSSTHRCSVCYKVFTSFTLRSCLRKKMCVSCGNTCCVGCCSHVVFDVETDSYHDICVHCVLIRSKLAAVGGGGAGAGAGASDL